MSISDKQDDSNEAGKLLKHLTKGLHHWKKRWLFHLLHYFIASYALLPMPLNLDSALPLPIRYHALPPWARWTACARLFLFYYHF